MASRTKSCACLGNRAAGAPPGTGRDPAGPRGQRRRRVHARTRRPDRGFRRSRARDPRRALRRQPRRAVRRDAPRRAWRDRAGLGPEPRAGGTASLLWHQGRARRRPGAGLRDDPGQRRRDRARLRPQRSRRRPGRLRPPVAALDGPGARRPAERLRDLPAARRSEPRARRRVEAAPDLLRRGAEGGLHLRRGRSRCDGPAGQSRALERRSDRAELGSPRQRSRRSGKGDLERKHRWPRPGRGSLRLPHQRARRGIQGGPARRSLRTRRRVGVALRSRVPGAWQSRLRRSRSPVRRGALRPLPPGPGRVRRLRHAAGRRPRRAR